MEKMRDEAGKERKGKEERRKEGSEEERMGLLLIITLITKDP